MKAYTNVNLVTCDSAFHVYREGLLAPVGLGRGALDEPVGLELLEQLVEGLLADVEEVGELASGDGALHLQGGEHPAASASGVGQGAGMGMGGDVTTTHEPMKAV